MVPIENVEFLEESNFGGRTSRTVGGIKEIFGRHGEAVGTIVQTAVFVHTYAAFYIYSAMEHDIINKNIRWCDCVEETGRRNGR